jgi:CRISPR-associated protein Csb3
MIGALGEPAYWPTDRNADAGASRWEMKTRNQGAEFVGNRLVPLAQAVAARTIEQTLTGLTG